MFWNWELRFLKPHEKKGLHLSCLCEWSLRGYIRSVGPLFNLPRSEVEKKSFPKDKRAIITPRLSTKSPFSGWFIVLPLPKKKIYIYFISNKGKVIISLVQKCFYTCSMEAFLMLSCRILKLYFTHTTIYLYVIKY